MGSVLAQKAPKMRRRDVGKTRNNEREMADAVESDLRGIVRLAKEAVSGSLCRDLSGQALWWQKLALLPGSGRRNQLRGCRQKKGAVVVAENRPPAHREELTVFCEAPYGC